MQWGGRATYVSMQYMVRTTGTPAVIFSQPSGCHWIILFLEDTEGIGSKKLSI